MSSPIPYNTHRCEDVGDLQDVSQDGVEKTANEIEDRLFAIHQDITPRYKTKYRSLLFNLKDSKNQVCGWGVTMSGLVLPNCHQSVDSH